MRECFQNKFVLRSSHQDVFFNIAVLHLWWNYLKNSCDGVPFLLNLHVTLSNFEPCCGKAQGYLMCWATTSAEHLWKYASAYRSSRSQMFFKIVFLKNFANFTGKHICWSLFLIKLQAFRSSAVLKRDSNTGIILWNLRNLFKNTFFTEHVLTVTASVCSENLGKLEQLTNPSRCS